MGRGFLFCVLFIFSVTGLSRSEPQPNRSVANVLLQYINAERAKLKLPVLVGLSELDSAATKRTAEILRLNYFSHSSPTQGREKVRQRIEAEGISPVRVAENLYQSAGYPPEKVPPMVIFSR